MTLVESVSVIRMTKRCDCQYKDFIERQIDKENGIKEYNEKMSKYHDNLDNGMSDTDSWCDAFDPEHKTSYWINTWECPHCGTENDIERTSSGVMKSICKKCKKNKNYNDYGDINHE